MLGEGLNKLREGMRDASEAVANTAADAMRDAANVVTRTAADAANTVTSTAADAANLVVGTATDAANLVTGTAADAVREISDLADETATGIRGALPTLSEVLSQAVLLPGVKVDRAEFLTSVLAGQPDMVVRLAIDRTPVRAGMTLSQLSRIAGKALGREARRTTVASMAVGLPGGVAAAATIPADLIQLYGHLVRAIQMLSYLYGWRDTCALGEGQMDETTRRALLLFLGAMAADERADRELARLAPLRLSDGVLAALGEERALKVVSQVSSGLEGRMAHRLGGQIVGKSVPLAGAVISGTMSYGGFSDMWKRLRETLAAIG